MQVRTRLLDNALIRRRFFSLTSREFTKKYSKDELPWSMKVAMKHPTMSWVTIFVGGDLGHCMKKNRNNVRLSGVEGHKRKMILDGQPVNLKMLQDVWECTSDFKDEGSLRLYRKLNKGVFVLNANSMLRTPEAMRVFSQSMLDMLKNYKSKNLKAAENTYDPIMRYIAVMDRFIDIMNGTRDKKCELINSADHMHVFELLDVVKFHTQWKNQAGKNTWAYQPTSTFEDTVWTCIGIVGVARKQLRGEHNIVQRRHGSDVCEESFCYKRDKNVNADHLNTNHIMARNSHNGLFNLAASRKANCGKRKTFFGFELDVGKIKRLRLARKGSKSVHR